MNLYIAVHNIFTLPYFKRKKKKKFDYLDSLYKSFINVVLIVKYSSAVDE